MSDFKMIFDSNYLRNIARYTSGNMNLSEALIGAAVRIETLESQLTAERERVRVHEVTGETSDGYHTFNELYEFRKVYNAALFNEWAAQGKYQVHKSYRHHDGELCFGGGWFIVVAMLPSGQISNHYENSDWGLFSVPEHETALFEYDGHTSVDVLDRLQATAQEVSDA